jgi:D-aspartate ligase
MKKESCALVLGGYVNGYSIIQELSEKGVKDIILFDNAKKFGAHSNKIKKFVLVENTPEALFRGIEALNRDYKKIISYPTDDLHIENLWKIREKIRDYCFLPFNEENIIEQSDKYVQYEWCEKLGVPYPKTIRINTAEDLQKMSSIPFPILIKPVKRDDLKVKVFRNLQLKSPEEYEEKQGEIKDLLKKGMSFIASEIIPGDGSNIYAYVGYRNRDGVILNEWTGKKLSQYPDDYGVFASASNQAPDKVREQGRTLLKGMNIHGIAEPEYKYDRRDGKYKLTEINYRSMMWHRAGNLSGVNLQYTQYLDALGKKAEKQTQVKDKDIHYVYLKHELVNLLARKGYYKTFYRNIFKSDKTHLAVLETGDMIPFAYDLKHTMIMMVATCLRRSKTALHWKSTN